MLLNSGRGCFEYVLRAVRPNRVFVPAFTCAAMFEPLHRLAVPHTRYAVDERLEPTALPVLGPGEILVYTNYFGLKDAFCRWLGARYGDALVLDCSQALYFAPLPRGHTFYSPRKFFGLPDGGVLYTSTLLSEPLDRDTTSHERASHLLKRVDLDPEAAYAEFRANDTALAGQPLRRMSRLTRLLLAGIDAETARRRRLANYRWLHRRLGPHNAFASAASIGPAGPANPDEPASPEKPANPDEPVGPLSYPFLAEDPVLRRKLIAERIFVPTFWPDILATHAPGGIEHTLADRLLHLPIDHRYTPADLQRIVEVLDAG